MSTQQLIELDNAMLLNLNFSLNFNELTRRCFELRPVIVVNNGWFVTSKNIYCNEGVILLDSYSPSQYQLSGSELVPNFLLEQDELVVGRVASDAQTSTSSLSAERFVTELLKYEILWVKRAFEHVGEYLKGRSIESASAAKHPVITQLMAGIAQDIYVISQVGDLKDKKNQQFVAEELYSIVSRLIKAAGGRSMLCGNLVQMDVMFKALNSVYLEKASV
ncbi:hypothetical protein [Pseudoalteromonas aurantia]|uniref:Uncharacterized protein n=1 Tax=Pseudoalteromonas aurantia 208 TaxID=1314867 RepID=A0ABR9E5Z9_9GAMM|nr:hypothetical protein [Pseudoalteromonas aurantia]MBE0366419.1 hypothetical protein [Pseudoalteromonas aurantia 208]